MSSATKSNGTSRLHAPEKPEIGEDGLTAMERQQILGFVTNEMSTRAQLFARMTDPKRDYDKELGYPRYIEPTMYQEWFERDPLAKRIVCLWPSEIWKKGPDVYEKEAASITTKFEEAWAAFKQRWNVWHYMRRVDEASRIGHLGLLLTGYNDNRPLNMPVEGINERGERVGSPTNKVIFLRVFAEKDVTVASLESDQSNPRFGQPTSYRVKFAVVASSSQAIPQAVGSQAYEEKTIHWSRVTHVAPNRRTSEVYGTPEMEACFNRLIDLKKTLGGSAEMFWRGAFAGLSIEAPTPVAGMAVPKFGPEERKALRKEIEAYANGLQRYMALVGMQAKSLAPQVADPTNHVDTQLKMVAIALNVPMRVLLGSEQAQLASGQDKKTWNDRVMGEMSSYTSPCIVRPTIERWITVGALPEPAKDVLGFYDFKIDWSDLNAPSEKEIAEIAQKFAASLKDYVQGGGRIIIPPKEWLIEIMKMPIKLATVIEDAAKKYVKENPEVKQIAQTPKGSASGKTNNTRPNAAPRQANPSPTPA